MVEEHNMVSVTMVIMMIITLIAMTIMIHNGVNGHDDGDYGVIGFA